MDDRRGVDWCRDCTWDTVDVTTLSDPEPVEILVMRPCLWHRFVGRPSALRVEPSR